MNNDPPSEQTTDNQSAPPPVVTSPPIISTHSHGEKDLFKTLFLILTPLLVVLSLVGGVLLGRTVFKEKTLEDKFLEQIYGEDLDGLEDTEGTAQDTERRTDINSIATQLEAYYADYGYYPSNTNANACDDEQVKTAACSLDLLVSRGLDDEALVDPNGVKIGVFGSNYAYEVSPTSCNQCDAYTLTADLAEETTDYEKQSLN